MARQSPVQPVNIGYGDSPLGYEIAQLGKADLALHGYLPRIDAQALMELVQIGIDGSQRLIPIVANCEVARWLVPKGEAPFAVDDVYYSNSTPLFSAAFRQAFADRYRLIETSAHFAIWECRH